MDIPTSFLTSPSVFDISQAREAHNGKDKVKTVSAEFAAIFVNEMLKSARKADVFKSKLFNSDQEKMAFGLYDQQLSLNMTRNHTFGIENLIEAQIKSKG